MDFKSVFRAENVPKLHDMVPHGKRTSKRFVCCAYHGHRTDATVLETDFVKKLNFHQKFRHFKKLFGARSPENVASMRAPRKIFEGGVFAL